MRWICVMRRCCGWKCGVHEEGILIRMAGYSSLAQSAEEVAAARHLLETVLRRPVIVKALRATAQPQRMNSRLQSSTGTPKA